MHKPCIYRIVVRGHLDESDLNTMSPLQTTVVPADEYEKYPRAATVFTIYADQSGLIGLIRHLHGRGIVLLSVRRG